MHCNFNDIVCAVFQIGGTEEYNICQGIVDGRITKPVVCWCIGTCATMFSSEVHLLHGFRDTFFHTGPCPIGTLSPCDSPTFSVVIT